MYICEYCGKTHNGKYGSGRFCNSTCSRKFSNSHISIEGRQRQIDALTNKDNRCKGIESRKLTSNLSNKLLFRERKQTASNTGIVGKVGEIATIKKFLDHGIEVYTPVIDNTKVDLVANFAGNLQKIQVKTSTRISGIDNGATRFELCSSGNTFDHGTITSKKTSYKTTEIDYFALYDYQMDDVYLLKNNNKQKEITLRHTSPLTGQKKNINYASDYQIDRVLPLLEQGINPEDLILIDPFIYDKK